MKKQPNIDSQLPTLTEEQHLAIDQFKKDTSGFTTRPVSSTLRPKGVLLLSILNFLAGVGYCLDSLSYLDSFSYLLEYLLSFTVYMGIGILGIFSALKLWQLQQQGWRLTAFFYASVCVNSFLQIFDPQRVREVEKALYDVFRYHVLYPPWILWLSFLITFISTVFIIYYLILVEDHFN